MILTKVVVPVGIAEAGEQNQEPRPLKLKEIPQQKNKINLNGVNLNEALRTLAEMAELNLITADSSIKGTVTAHLQNLSIFKAIKLLVKSHGLDYKIIAETIIVGTEEKLRTGFGEEVTRVFKLNNAQPQQVKANLSLLVNKKTVQINQRSDKLLIKTYESKLPRIKRTIQELDQPRKQVAIRVRLEEISKSGLQELGINWSFGKLEFNTNQSEEETDSTSLEIGSATLDYESILELLAKSNQSSTLATPRLITVDGETATINIGESIPIVKQSQEKTQVEFKDVGINLKITPQITGSEEVYVEVNPEVSVVKKYLEAANAKYPVIGTRKAETTVRINDGQTIALGGLIKEEEVEKMSKIPFLSDLPLLGNLFKNTSNDTKKQELVIFLTPKIISNNSVQPDKLQGKKPGIIPVTYQVQAEDTLWQISQLFNVSFIRIINYNNSKLIKNLQSGTKLKIPVPAAHYYTVKSGTTIQQLAEQYGFEPRVIKMINGINSLRGRRGEKVILPGPVSRETGQN